MSHLGSGRDFLTTENLVGTLNELWIRGTQFGFARYYRDTYQQGRDIEMDVARLTGTGMTPATAANSATSLVGDSIGAARVKYGTQDWREKKQWTAADALKIRSLGTACEETNRSVSALVVQGLLQLRDRLEYRLEKLRVDALVEGSVQYRVVGGGVVQIPYPMPANLNRVLTGTDVWSDSANSKPLDDIGEWIDQFEDMAVSEKYEFVMSPKVNLALRKNAQWITLGQAIFQNTANSNYIQQTFRSGNTIDPRMVNMITAQVGSDVSFSIYRGSTTGVTENLLPVASGGTTIDLVDPSELGTIAAGDMVTLTNRAQNIQVKVEVTSLVGRTLTLAAPLASAIAQGTQVVKNRPFMDPNKVLLVARFDESQADGVASQQNPTLNGAYNVIKPDLGAEMVYTENAYNLDDAANKPGVFVKYSDREHEDPPAVDVLIGAAALPRINYPEFYLRAKVI